MGCNQALVRDEGPCRAAGLGVTLTCDLCYCDACLGGRLKVYMVAAYACCECQLELWCLGYTLGRQVSWKEGGCDYLQDPISQTALHPGVNASAHACHAVVS